MALQAQHSGSEAAPPSTSATSPFSSIKSLTERIAAWIQTRADVYAVAALYDGLRELSDAELHKRGLSRKTLARDVCRVLATGQSAVETSPSDGKVHNAGIAVGRPEAQRRQRSTGGCSCLSAKIDRPAGWNTCRESLIKGIILTASAAAFLGGTLYIYSAQEIGSGDQLAWLVVFWPQASRALRGLHSRPSRARCCSTSPTIASRPYRSCWWPQLLSRHTPSGSSEAASCRADWHLT